MFILYTDESIIAGPNQEDLDAALVYMKKSNLEVNMVGTLEDFLEVNTDRRKYDMIHLRQPQRIEKIVKDLG